LYGLRASLDRLTQSGIEARVASPRVLKPGEARIADFLKSLNATILVRSAGLLKELSDTGDLKLVADFSLNVANSISAAAVLEFGVERITPTHDLNAMQVAELALAVGGERIEAVAYQHLPVFHTEHCMFCRFLSTGTTYRDCGRPCEKHEVALKDERSREHPVMADVGCRNTVFGAEAQEASLHLDNWQDAGIRHLRLEFVHEKPDEVATVVEAFERFGRGDIRTGELNAELQLKSPAGTTEGSLFVPKTHTTLPVLQ
jgi:putative protease